MRATGPRGQYLQGTVEIRRDLRHLWPKRPTDALLHSKPTCPARSRRCCPCSPPPISAISFSAPPTGGGDGSYGGGAYGRGYGDGSYVGGAYGYGGSDGDYSDGAYSGPYDHGGHGDAGYEAEPVGQSPGGGGGGYDIPSRPPAAPDRGYHRAIQQAGDGGDGVAFAAEDGGHEDEGCFGDPLSSVFGGPESGPGPTAYVLQLPTSKSRFLSHVVSAVFTSKRLGATTVIGDSSASGHTFGNGTHLRNKRLPAAEEAYLIIGDGERLPVACYGDLDLVLHCETYGKPWSNVRVTLKNVAVVPGIWFDLISFNQIQEAHPVLLDKGGAHILGSRILFTKHASGNYVQATKVAHVGSPAVCLNPGMPATTAPSATVPPAMAAAVLRPGATTSADINHLRVSLGHAHDGNLRETAKQMGIRATGTLVPCSECAVAKGIRRSVSRSTAWRATKPLELLYGDLSGAMPASTGVSVYCFFIVDCYSNLGWPILLKDKSTDTVTHAFRASLAAIKPLREKHGEPGAFRTDNGTEFVNKPFANLLVQYGIRRKFTSVDGPKRNGRVERRIALVKEGARAAWLGFPRLYPDVRFPSRAMHYSAVWPEACTWMSENINITSRVDSPDKRYPEEKLYGKRLRKQLLRQLNSGPKWAGKADPCFCLNGGKDNFGLRQGDAGVRDRQLHHQCHMCLPPCPLRRPTGHIWKRGHPHSFAAAGRHVDGREWNRRSGRSIGGKRRRHRSLSATGRIVGGEGRRRRSARSPEPQRGHWRGHHPSFTVAGRTVDGRRHQRSYKSIGGVV